MKVLDKISKLAAYISEILAALILGSMALVVFIQVVLRFIFNTGIYWSDQYARFSIIWAVMLIANVLIKEDDLIKVDFLDALWPRRFIKIRDAIYQAILLFILLLLMFKGWENAVDGIKSTIPGLKLPWFWAYLSIPIGASLMLYQYTYRLLLIFSKGEECK